MTQFKTWFFVGSLTLLILGGCSSLSSRVGVTLPAELPNTTELLDLVAEGLGSVAFNASLATLDEAEGQDVTPVKEALRPLIEKERGALSKLDYWQIRIVESEQADAVAFAGGGLLVNSALLQCPADLLLARTSAPAQDGCTIRSREENVKALPKVLAVVLSHEVSHVAERHFLKRLKANSEAVLNQVVKQLFKEITSGKLPHDPAKILARVKTIKFSTADLEMLIAAAGLTAGGELLGHPFMEEQELSADCHGAELMSRAGHDPKDALRFWERNSEGASEGGRLLFRTHPPTPERLRQLRACIRERSLDVPAAVARRAR